MCEVKNLDVESYGKDSSGSTAIVYLEVLLQKKKTRAVRDLGSHSAGFEEEESVG